MEPFLTGLIFFFVILTAHYSINFVHGSYLSIDHMPAGGIFIPGQKRFWKTRMWKQSYLALPTSVRTALARAIRENHQPKTGLEQALIIQKITDAIYASAEQGRVIEINE